MVNNSLHSNWSAELKDLQDETIRLLHTIRGDSGPQKRHRSRRHVDGREGKSQEAAGSKASHRGRKRRLNRRTIDVSEEAEMVNLETIGSREISHTLDASRWPVKGTLLQTSAMGIGKATVEVLDKGKETPRNTFPSEAAAPPAHRSCGGTKETQQVSQTADIAVIDEAERRFRSLSFKNEEFRVRGSADTYILSGGSLTEELQRLKAERDRLAGIEEAQRETCQEKKHEEFLRFARRKWLACDRAAESMQRVFRGYVGRMRARLTAEVRRLMGKANADWVEVRDHDHGEAWYYNPTSGKSQWDRPAFLQGTIAPSEKIQTLPALGSPPTEQEDYQLSCNDVGDGFAAKASAVTPNIDRVRPDVFVSSAEPTNLSEGSRGVGAAAEAPKTTATVEGSVSRGASALTAHTLPPLMNGARYSTPPKELHTTGLAPYSTPGVTFTGIDGRDKTYPVRQQAWAEQEEGDKGEEFPFLTGNRILPDDHFEDTGIGLARKTEEIEEERAWNPHGPCDSSESAQGFFLADGTPNIRLRRTIAKALQVSKFDSVSTLIADYTVRCTENRATTAAATTSEMTYMPNSDLKPAARTRMASTAPATGSRTDSKRGRNRTARSATGFLDDAAPYPTGKLEQDKSSPLFNSSIVGGGRRMVSVMTGAGRKATRDVKTAGKRRKRDRGGTSTKGLAIRDLPPSGFELPPGGANMGRADASVGSEGDVYQRFDKEALGNLGQKEDSAGVRGKQVPGEDGVETQGREVKEICFNCWSKGSGKTCTLHTNTCNKSLRGRPGVKAGEIRMAESALMCNNWDIGVMRRRYRSEELQEIFAKETSSLKYDKERKKFISIVGERHLIYRMVSKTIASYNFTTKRKIHQRKWLRSFLEQLRIGKLPGVLGVPGKNVHRSSKVLQLRNTLHNTAQIKAYTSTIKSIQPQPSITGSTLAEKRGLARVIVDRPSAVTGRVTHVVLDGPTPATRGLSEAKRYHLPPAKTMPLPDPNYPEVDDPDEGREAFGGVNIDCDGGKIHSAGWMVKFCETAAGDIVHSAATNVKVMSPVPDADDTSRSKTVPSRTIKFATFSRKSTPGMMAVGGLPAEMVIHMLVSTRIPPQYGNFTVMQKSSVAPTVTPEVSVTYKSLEVAIENQLFVPRPLNHPLNGRKAPTVMVKVLMADPENRHYFGFNRPEQTGESDSHGFRTSSHADTAPTLQTLDPTAFLPSEDVVTSNLCCANRTVTTNVDMSYPFCETSNRSNTTLDFYHLMLTATCSPNKEQVFTNLGVQECGEFMRGGDPLRPLGHCVGMVYRSWAFLQKQPFEEFETDDGIPYWFDRRTGETFWERPLCDEEKVPVKQGGTVLSGRGEPPDSSCGAFEDVKPRYDQKQMRRLMMKTHEDVDRLKIRRKQVATGVKWARSSGALPAPDPDDLEPPKQDPDADKCLEPAGDGLAEERASDDTIQQPTRRRNDPRYAFCTSSQNVPGDGLGDEDEVKQHREYDSGPQSGGDREGERAKGRGKGGIDRSDQDASGGSCSKAESLVASIAQVLDAAGLKDLNKSEQVKPSDMLRFGMGIGISLGASGLLGTLGDDSRRKPHEGDEQGRLKTRGAHDRQLSDVEEVPPEPLVVKISPNGHPIGHGHPEPIAQRQESNILDHKSEEEHLAAIVRDSAKLKTSEEFKGLLVVPHENLTPFPDEDHGLATEDPMVNPRRKAELGTPIIAYPEMLWKKQYRGHNAAGEGESWIPAGGDRALNQRAKSSLGVSMRRTNEPLPEGFLNAIYHTHVAKQNCDYLPQVPNMPQARTVGRVRPRPAAEDWFAVGFDPWSAGREPLRAEFVSTLSIKQEDLGGDVDDARGGIVPQADYLNVNAATGHTNMAVVSEEEAKLAKDFEQITSWARHGHNSEIVTAMSQEDWNMPIDYQNELGLTLLHVACQNANKRIAKLCLRKGADINKRNNNGQTPLHYAYGYGYESFGEYLVSQGADDSITNADGLTCYEGLSQDDL